MTVRSARCHYTPVPVLAIIGGMEHRDTHDQHQHDDDKDQNDQEKLDRFLTLCLGIYERMEREGSWPWGDSQELGDVVESDSKKSDI